MSVRDVVGGTKNQNKKMLILVLRVRERSERVQSTARREKKQRAEGWKRQDVSFSPVHSPLAVGRGTQSRAPSTNKSLLLCLNTYMRRDGRNREKRSTTLGFLNAPKLPGGMNL